MCFIASPTRVGPSTDLVWPVLQHYDQQPRMLQHDHPPTIMSPPVDESTDDMLTAALKNNDANNVIMGFCHLPAICLPSA